MPIKERFDNYPRKTNKTKKRYLMPSYNKKDNYLFYKKDIPHKSKSIYNINKTKFNEVIDLYNVSLLEMIKEGILIQLPERLGGLQLLKKKCRINPRQEAVSDKKGLQFENTYWAALVTWYKNNVKCKGAVINIKLYSFKVTKEFSLELHKLMDQGLHRKLFTRT